MNQAILDAIREGRRRAVACAEGDCKKSSNDDCDGQLVEVPFAPEDNDGSASTNADNDKRSDKAIAIQDETGQAAMEACNILKSVGGEEKELIATAQSIFDGRNHSDDASTTKPLDQYTTEEGRVLVRLLYLLSSESPPTKAFVQYGYSHRLPWHIRTECLRCLWSDITPTAAVGANLNRNDWDKLLKLVGGIEDCSPGDGAMYPQAQVRSAALKVISTHRYNQTLPRLIHLCSRYDDNSNEKMDSKTPLPGWFDGVRQVELARALLGDASCYASVVMHLYDPTESEREEAKDVLVAIANDIGGSVEVARRIVIENNLINDRGELPDFIDRPFQIKDNDREKERANMVWEYLIENHWNELIIRWASDATKSCKG